MSTGSGSPHGPFSRLHPVRQDPDWLRRTLASDATRVLLVAGDHVLCHDTPGSPPFLPTVSEARMLGLVEAPLVLVGAMGPTVYAAASPPGGPREGPPGTSWHSLRSLPWAFEPGWGHVVATARALLHWQSIAKHCGRCGAATEPREGGMSALCPACGYRFYARIDPAVMVLVTRGDQALLVRQPGWPAGRYSAVAGFVEPGESLEEAAAREVAEETGLSVDEVHYVCSQPWPFPATLMVGCRAVCSRGEPTVADGELEDARWMGRSELLEALSKGIMSIPPPHSLASKLLRRWMAEAGRCLPSGQTHTR